MKIHLETKLKYFGKTVKNPFIYRGSGKYWTNHIRKYGNNVLTLIIHQTEDALECKRIALEFSIENKIVESRSWANLIPENGQDGAPEGHKNYLNEIGIEKITKETTERWKNEEYRNRVIQTHIDRWNDPYKNLRERQSIRLKTEFWTEERKKSHSEKLKGRTPSEDTKMKMRKPKHADHGKHVSASLTGKPKSEEHKHAISLAKKGKKVSTRKYNPVTDHLGNEYDNVRRLTDHYNLSKDFFDVLDKPIRYKSVYEKLGIPYTDENRQKTKRELGFDFKEPSI